MHCFALISTIGKEEGGRTTPGMEAKTGRATLLEDDSNDKTGSDKKQRSNQSSRQDIAEASNERTDKVGDGKQGQVEPDQNGEEMENLENGEKTARKENSESEEKGVCGQGTVEVPDRGNPARKSISSPEKSQSFTDSFSQFLAEGKSAEPTRQDDQVDRHIYFFLFKEV